MYTKAEHPSKPGAAFSLAKRVEGEWSQTGIDQAAETLIDEVSRFVSMPLQEDTAEMLIGKGIRCSSMSLQDTANASDDVDAPDEGEGTLASDGASAPHRAVDGEDTLGEADGAGAPGAVDGADAPGRDGADAPGAADDADTLAFEA